MIPPLTGLPETSKIFSLMITNPSFAPNLEKVYHGVRFSLKYTQTTLRRIFTSRVSSWGNRIGPVCVSVCECVCVCNSALSRLNCLMYEQSIGLCVSIHHGNRTLGRGNFTTWVAGGASTLRRFHFYVFLNWLLSISVTKNCMFSFVALYKNCSLEFERGYILFCSELTTLQTMKNVSFLPWRHTQHILFLWRLTNLPK